MICYNNNYQKMNQEIIECHEKSGDLQSGAYRVTNFITQTTESNEFDSFVSQHPGYKIEYGGRCGWNALGSAAYHGNAHLVEHIVNKYGKHLINLGNGFGWTPLFCAANCLDLEAGYETSNKLIKFGANVNISVSCSGVDSKRGLTDRGDTPLSAAISKTKNRKLVELLLKHGALCHDSLLNDKDKEFLNEIKENMKKINVENDVDCDVDFVIDI